MKRYAVVMAVLAALGLATQCAEAGRFRKSVQPVPGKYIVVFKGQAMAADDEAKISLLAHRHNARIGERWKRAINGFVAEMSEADALALAQDPSVALVEEDGIVSINATQTQSGATWGLDRIDQRNLPLNTSYLYDTNGQGVTAYIVDTGIRATHQDFLTATSPIVSRVTGGFTSISDGQGTNDCNGHGTHVAGTVGGNTYGVAKGVSLVPVRVLDCAGSGAISGVVAGLNWVVIDHNSNKLPAVVNMSLGGGTSTSLDTAVQNVVNAGVTVVVAAGNSNANACNYSPSRVPAAITVGATGSMTGTVKSPDVRASYSNYGSCVDIFAPGDGVTSAYYSSNTAMATLSGTSMASPHVAGVAALYLGVNQGSTPSQVSGDITNVNNATAGTVTSPGAGSPNLLLYSRFITVGPPDTTPPLVALTAPVAADPLTVMTGTVTLSAEASDPEGMAKVDFYVDYVDSNSESVGSVNNPTGTSSTGAGIYSIPWNSRTVANGVHRFSAIATNAAGLSTITATNPAVPADIENSTPPTPVCTNSAQLLVNGGFEQGASGWAASSAVINNSQTMPARSGNWKAWLNGYGRVRTNTLYQQVTIPADACSATLNFWLRIITRETGTAANDTLTVTARNTGGNQLGTPLAVYSNRVSTGSSYIQQTIDLSAYLGQTIRLQFTGVENASLATSFLIDDAALSVIVP